MVHAPGSDTAALEKLAAELAVQGFEAVLTPPGRWPSLEVCNPDTARSENIEADEDWFWWSDGERIAPVSDITIAAGTIARVLAAGEGRR